MWKGHRSTDKRYARDNRLITPKRPNRRGCLAPRCRLITSWSCRRFQGFGCSPIKVVRELGLERCETVRSLSTTTRIEDSYSSTGGSSNINQWWPIISKVILVSWIATLKNIITERISSKKICLRYPQRVEDYYIGAVVNLCKKMQHVLIIFGYARLVEW